MGHVYQSVFWDSLKTMQGSLSHTHTHPQTYVGLYTRHTVIIGCLWDTHTSRCRDDLFIRYRPLGGRIAKRQRMKFIYMNPKNNQFCIPIRITRLLKYQDVDKEMMTSKYVHCKEEGTVH